MYLLWNNLGRMLSQHSPRGPELSDSVLPCCNFTASIVNLITNLNRLNMKWQVTLCTLELGKYLGRTKWLQGSYARSAHQKTPEKYLGMVEIFMLRSSPQVCSYRFQQWIVPAISV